MTVRIQAAVAAFLAMTAAFGANLTLPVANVAGKVDDKAKSYPGRVAPVNFVELKPEVGGRIVEVCYTNGSIVAKDSVLFRLNDVKYRAAFSNALARVAECAANKDLADANYDRYEETMKGKGGVPLKEVDKARAERIGAASALAAAEAELEVARYNLACCEVKAPIAGKIGTVRLTEGNFASPEKDVLVTIVTISPIRVRFAISNADFLRMFQGSSSNLIAKSSVNLLLSDGSTYDEKGRIEYTENAANESTDTLTVVAQFANTKRKLRPGGTVGVTLSNRDGMEKPVIPPSALMQDVRGTYVWVLDGSGVAAKRYIVCGRQMDDKLFVTYGLAVGERVVTDGTHKVAPGDVVTPAP